MISTIETLKKTPLFASLAAPELTALAQSSIEHKLKKNEILFTAGEIAKGLYVLAQGSIRAFRESEAGREQVIHTEKAVTTFAEVAVFDGGAYPSTVAAEEDSRVLFISKENMDRLCLKHPSIALAALKLLAARLRRCASLVESLSLKDVEQRLLVFLRQELEAKGIRTDKGWTVRLPDNTRIASRVGSVREVVSRAFNRFQKEGLLTMDSRHNLTVLDEKTFHDRAQG